MLPNIHIVGIQGSGKGTQSSLLVERFHLTYASSGNLFRKRSQIPDELGMQLTQQLTLGKLLPNPLLFSTIDHFLSENPTEVGFLGDGVIRTLDQYRGLQPIWERHNLAPAFLIHLELSEEVALERIKHRLEEQENPEKQLFHKVYGGKLAHRTDDNPLAIEERFRLFHELTTPVINEFRASKRYARISADQSIETIHSQIVELLEATYPELTHGTD